MLSEGLYKVAVSKKRDGWGLSRNNKGTHQFVLSVEVKAAASEDAEEILVEDEKGKPIDPPTRTIFLYVTEKTWERTLKELKVIGYPHPRLIPAALTKGHADAFNFDGLEFTAECKHEEYQGKPKERWSVYVPRSAPLDPEGLAQFESLFGGEPAKDGGSF